MNGFVIAFIIHEISSMLMKARSCLIILTTCWFWDFRLSRKKSKLKTTYAYYPASLCEFPTFTGHLISRIWRDSNSLGFIFFDFKKQRHQISRFKFSLLHFILQKNKHNAFFEINFKVNWTNLAIHIRMTATCIIVDKSPWDTYVI